MILKRCNKPGCTEHIPRSQTPAYCEQHRRERVRAANRRYDKHRNQQSKQFYNSKSWASLRAIVLTEAFHMCECCKAKGEYTRADTVHHIVEIKDDWSKRLERSNCMAVCRTCHESFHERGFS